MKDSPDRTDEKKGQESHVPLDVHNIWGFLGKNRKTIGSDLSKTTDPSRGGGVNSYIPQLQEEWGNAEQLNRF